MSLFKTWGAVLFEGRWFCCSGGSIGGSGTTRAQGVQKRARCSKGCAAAAVAAAEVGAGEGADSHASARHAAVKTEVGRCTLSRPLHVHTCRTNIAGWVGRSMGVCL